MGEQRYFVALRFWQWCYANRISADELAVVTGYSSSLIKQVRNRTSYRTVSQRFVDRVEMTYYVPADVPFFIPAPPRETGEQAVQARTGSANVQKKVTVERS